MKTWARPSPLLRQWQTKINTRHPLLNKYFPPDKLLLVSWWWIMGEKSCFTAVVRVHCACMCEGIIPFACCLQQLSGILRMAWFFLFFFCHGTSKLLRGLWGWCTSGYSLIPKHHLWSSPRLFQAHFRLQGKPQNQQTSTSAIACAHPHTHTPTCLAVQESEMCTFVFGI